MSLRSLIKSNKAVKGTVYRVTVGEDPDTHARTLTWAALTTDVQCWLTPAGSSLTQALQVLQEGAVQASGFSGLFLPETDIREGQGDNQPDGFIVTGGVLTGYIGRAFKVTAMDHPIGNYKKVKFEEVERETFT